MRMHLSDEDIRAGVPTAGSLRTDISLLYADWRSLCHSEQRQIERIQELDADIQKMEPWGDYPMSRIDQLAQRGLRLLFWRCSRIQYEGHRQMWIDDYQAELVSEHEGECYFVTVTPQGVQIVLPEAQPIDVTPSPVSTLIMLQTRAKDSLRQIRIEMGDFALQHYREVESELGLSDTLHVQSKRRRLMGKIKSIFVRNK